MSEELRLDELRLQRLVIEDSAGTARMMLSCNPDDGNPVLSFLDRQGKSRLGLALSGDKDGAVILVQDASGVHRLSIVETDNELMKEVDPDNYTPETGVSFSVKDATGTTVCAFGTSGDFVHFKFTNASGAALYDGVHRALDLPGTEPVPDPPPDAVNWGGLSMN